MEAIPISQNEFTALGRALLGGDWEEGQEAYEAYWLGEASPQRTRGDLFLLGESGGRARLAVFRPAEDDALFFLYARQAGLAAEAVQGFLASARAFCRARGMAELTGPLQFSTWHPYRFVSGSGPAAFFPGEQKMPAAYHGDFRAAGFADIAEYESTLVEDLAASIELGLSMGVDRGLEGVEVRTLGSADLGAFLPELYRASCEIFAGNFAYAPIDYADFARLSAGGKGDGALILATSQGRTAAFAYGYAIGPYDAGDGPAPTAVLKTLGVTPEFRSRGLGYAVSYLTHRHWLEKGCRRIIHAYMKSDNRSRSMSAHFGKRLRAYALMKGPA